MRMRRAEAWMSTAPEGSQLSQASISRLSFIPGWRASRHHRKLFAVRWTCQEIHKCFTFHFENITKDWAFIKKLKWWLYRFYSCASAFMWPCSPPDRLPTTTLLLMLLGLPWFKILPWVFLLKQADGKVTSLFSPRLWITASAKPSSWKHRPASPPGAGRAQWGGSSSDRSEMSNHRQEDETVLNVI